MITVSDLHYTYPGNHSETLSGVSFTVEPGEIFGLLGLAMVGFQRAVYRLNR